MIFNNDIFNWEKVVEEIKVLSWKILKARDKSSHVIFMNGIQIR
jgi:hypothetical protein